jgi:formate/nitrite transporter FocA (FNT family)
MTSRWVSNMKLTQDEQKLIRQAQASVKDKWRPLTIAAMFGCMLLYICFTFAYKVLQMAESFEDISEGFAFGFGLCIIATTTGIGGAICIGKALAGFSDNKEHELLLKLYNELEEHREQLH